MGHVPVSLPYFSAGSAKTSPTGTASLYTNYTYDPLSRVTATTDSVGTVTNTYNDRKLTVTDKRGKAKDLFKDAYGNLVQVDEHNSGSTYTTYYNYNYLGNLTKITDALGNVRNFTYNGMDHRLSAEDLHAVGDATFGVYGYDYDNNGNLTQKTDPKGNVVNYTYDDTNRVLTENYTGTEGTEVTYTYDQGINGIGRLTNILSGDFSQTNTYDALGRASSESKTISGVPMATGHGYDRQGNEVTITNPDDSSVSYLYNNAGSLEKVRYKQTASGTYQDVVSNFDYTPTGQVSVIAYANGVTTTNTYNAAQLYRLTSKVSLKGANHLQDLAYTYDNNDNIIQLVDASSTAAAKTVDYVYDDLNRLTSATAGNVAEEQKDYTETYAYDAIGNMLSKNGVAYTYAGNIWTNYANPHAVTKTGSGPAATTYAYDENGNMLSMFNVALPFNYTYDYNNRLVSASAESSSTYLYDPSGQRISQTTDGQTTLYPSKHYNQRSSTDYTKHIMGNGLNLASVQTTGQTPQTGEPVPEALHYTLTDHLSGSSVVTNSEGAQEELMDYFPYGGIRIDIKQEYNEQRKYTGQEYDVDTGLYYMNARYQNPAIGRFVSQDPVFLAIGNNGQIKQLTQQDLQQILADPQNLNSYAYGRNNPLSYNDPTGQWSVNIFAVLPNSWQVGIGNAANNAYNNNAVARYALDHPYQAGAAIGVLGGAAIAGGVVAAGGSITCGILCGGTAATVATTAGPVVGSQTDRVSKVANGLRLGQNVPSLGKVIENAPGKITGFNHDGTFHGLDQVISRGVSPQALQNTVNNPLVRFEGRYDRTGYLSREAYVVLDKGGQVVTSWTSKQFGPAISNVLKGIK